MAKARLARFRPALLSAILLVVPLLVGSCNTINTVTSEVQPKDLCKCNPLNLGLEYRHAEKHVPIPAMTPVEVTIDTIYTWPQADPGVLDPPRTGVELQVFHLTTAYLQAVHVNSEDCDVVFEVSQTPDKTARRMIVETPVDSEFCSARKNIQTQLLQHGFKLDVENGGELTPALPVSATGLAFLDFNHVEIGLTRGSAYVQTLWELHPAIVTLLP
ncbi:MAG: hypothetical protein M3O09_18360 [Acidobacteriota bacterium]|nr:hypothetical protein [Acidobacteriota bacterium]